MYSRQNQFLFTQEYREFLGGFRKRKLERKRKAQEQLQQQLKEERKKIKQEVSHAITWKCFSKN